MEIHLLDDRYLDHEISRVQVVRLSPEAQVPPGLPRVPEPGEVFVSPALARLIESDPEVLGHRYGDTITGIITPAGLAAPRELVVISGHPVEEGPRRIGLVLRELPGGFHQEGVTLLMRAVIIVGVVVLLFPIVMFIAAAARLNAQENDVRLAALRLAGADPQRVRWIVAWESVFAALPGILLGLAMFFAVRPLAAQVQFGGAAFFPSDLALNWISMLALLLVPVVVVGASFIGLRDVEISPLGVSRRATRRTVRPVGFLFLIPGLVLLWYVLDPSGRANLGGLDPVFGLVSSVIMILLGVALIGTWLGQAVASASAARVHSGAALLALRRIVSDPRASFRTVSGVTFAVFAGTLFLSLSAALEREITVEPPSGLRPNAIQVYNDTYEGMPDLPAGSVAVSISGLGGESDTGHWVNIQQGDCDQLARVQNIEGGCNGRMAVWAASGLGPGDSFVLETNGPGVRVTIPEDAHIFNAVSIGGWIPDVILPAGTFDWFDEFTFGQLVVAPPDGVGPGSREFEQIRTALIRAYPSGVIYSGGEFDDQLMSALRTMRNLVYMGTFAVFALSGTTAAMAVAGGILARRRAFALLRMSGCSLGVLRRVVMTEATLPLVLVSMVSALTAVGVSALMIWRIGEGSVLPPPEFALPLVAGLALGLVLPLMTLPLLGTVTRLEQTRFE